MESIPNSEQEEERNPPKEKRIKLKVDLCVDYVDPASSPISSLPDELILRILSFLNFPELLRANLVSQRLNKLCMDGVLWKVKFIEVFGSWEYLKWYKHLQAKAVSPSASLCNAKEVAIVEVNVVEDLERQKPEQIELKEEKCCKAKEDVHIEKQINEEQINSVAEWKDVELVEQVGEESWRNYFVEEYKRSMNYLRQMNGEEVAGVGSVVKIGEYPVNICGYIVNVLREQSVGQVKADKEADEAESNVDFLTTVLLMEETLKNVNNETKDHVVEPPISVYSEGVYEVQLFSWEKEELFPEHEHPLGQSSPCSFIIRPLERLIIPAHIFTKTASKKPKRPYSAFMLFIREKITERRSAEPDFFHFSSVITQAGKSWSEMNTEQKSKYMQTSFSNVASYRQQLTEFHLSSAIQRYVDEHPLY